MGGSAEFVVLLLKCSNIGIGAILGVLARVGINILFGPTKANITSREGVLFFDLPANVVGCFLMGVHNSIQSSWRIPSTLSLGLSTGFAGSLTTFASWHLQVIQMLVGGSVLQGFLAMFVGVCLAASAMVIGTEFGNLIIYASQCLNTSLTYKPRHPCESVLAGSDWEDQDQTSISYSNSSMSKLCVLALFVSLLAGMITGMVVDHMDNASSRLFWTSAMFAPVGALLRWRLSFLNQLNPQFPIGTYVANMLATVFDLALLTVTAIHKNLSSETLFFFTALIAGLGGSLSTVSTWISESFKLSPAQRYCYILCTMTSAIFLGITIYGIPVWVGAT